MTWLLPLGFLGLAGVIALIVIYIIKPNYQNKYISSTYVWRLSLKYRKKRLPLNKLNNILQFLCQCLILTICGLLLAQPVIVSEKVGDENEKVMAYILRRVPGWQAVEVPVLADFRSSLADFPCYRLLPSHGFGAGGFCCLLKKNTEQ